MDDRIKKIADYYGYEAQSRLLFEEMSELTKVVNKEWRFANGFLPEADYMALVDNIAEEIGDVEIMLDQIKYLLKIEGGVDDWKERKLKRTLENIEPEKMVKVIEGVHSITIKDSNQKSYRWRIDDEIKIGLGDVVCVNTKYGIDRAWVVGIKDVPESEAKQYRTAIGKVEFIDEQQR